MTNQKIKHVPINRISVNRKGLSDYEILKEYECGIELLGHEVKSLRAGNVNLKGSFITVRATALFLQKMHISPYSGLTNRDTLDPERERKVLLHKQDILHISQKIREKGFTLIPTEIYFKGNLVKVKIALAKGKKLYEKKETLKRRDIEMEVRKDIAHRLRNDDR